ncbi:MAG: potassium channel protein [Deltaproteobacteria bacterium]|jgi:voltage-gated potassium channel|nr:potassium channel protein [Deltaproteobacteria bacterium]MDL1987667.1 potassium channel protein [Deltaproteobacteria bacterium]
MDSERHLIVSFLLTLLIVGFGTAGYMAIEGWELLDAFYMTVITMGTVGYDEVHEISKTGRLFTVLLIFFGVGYFVYLAGVVVQFMVEGRMRTILGRRRLDKKIDRLKNHYIVCGYGRIGRVLCKNLQRKPLDLVVIEKNRELVPVMDEDKVLYVCGDVSDEANLIKAGIKRAKGLVAVLATDADNVFLVLTARQLNPDLNIVARACQVESKAKLRAAGANNVESPYEMGGVSMAQRILRPTVTNFLDLAFAYKRKDIQMEEIPVSPSSALSNVMLKDSGIRQQFNLIIIAIKKSDDSMLFNPSFETLIKAGDTVIAVGEEANLKKLEDILNPLLGG